MSLSSGKLSIDLLKPEAYLRQGNIYAVLQEDEHAFATLLWRTLLDTSRNSHSICLISTANIAKSLRDSGLTDEVHAAIDAGSIQIFQTDPECERLPLSLRVPRLIEELRHAGAAPAALLVIDGAERLFTDMDAAIVHQWRAWAEQQGCTLLLLFRLDMHDGGKTAAKLLPLSDMFGGMAGLKNRYGALTWEILHWFSPSGVTAGKSLPLQHTDDGRLCVASASGNTGFAPAADDARVLAWRPVFLANETVPGAWEILDNDLETLPVLLSSAMAATVLLAYTQTTPFSRLARCIYDLRKTCGPHLKIVVRELNTRLRYSQETLAVRLGANLIVPAEINYARFLSLTSMVQGQVFPHSVPDDYEQAVGQAAPQEQGYLPPQDFLQAVTDTMTRNHALRIQSTLIRLPLAFGLLPLDALRYCFIKRPGDLCCSDDSSVYLFLYACREADVDTALDRLFALPVSELFSADERFLSAQTIRDAMDDFAMRNDATPFSDLSAELATLNGAAPRERVTTLASQEKKGPVVTIYPAPVPAVRRPLSLRGAPHLTDVSVDPS